MKFGSLISELEVKGRNDVEKLRNKSKNVT